MLRLLIVCTISKGPLMIHLAEKMVIIHCNVLFSFTLCTGNCSSLLI
jgi:hypothetical protein